MSEISQDPELLRDFLSEAGELLDDVDARLVELEQRPGDGELLNRIFRGFHTIKGGAGFLEATALVNVCHRTETLFDKLRSNAIALDAELMDDILAATAEVRRMFGEMASGAAPTDAAIELLESLTNAASGGKRAKAVSAPAPATPAANEPDWLRLYEALIGPAKVSVPEPAAARAASVPAAPRRAAKSEAESTIRVDTLRFDRILTLSGEIGLAKNRLGFLRSTMMRSSPDSEVVAQLDLAVNRLGALVSDLQTVVMKSRMQPVGRVFHKYSRVARDLARQLGKDVDFALEGEDTEIDKTILEELNDPIVHLVRNSVDHGIELPADRLKAGKPARGSIVLSARQAGDRIVIEIRDDGRGMSAQKLREKAVEKGVTTAEAAGTLDDRQSLELIFMPGFSTKEAVTDLSGRGVGMDVVKTNIEKLKGRIELASRPGEGSRTTIVLPLTLAILPVLTLRVGNQPFAVPLAAVREVIAIDESRLKQVSGRPSLVLRNEALPVVSLETLIGAPSGGKGGAGIVAHLTGRELVLRADAVIGRDDVMIKPLEGVKPRGIAGATLSGDGVVILVLELEELLDGLEAA